MPSPYSYNMAAQARYLSKPHGRIMVLALGDSTFTETSYPRLFGGIMRSWDSPFAGLYLPYLSTAWEGSWASANTTNITNTTIIQGQAFADATVNRFPQSGREMVWSANTPNSNNVNLHFISSRTNYLRGEWIGSNPMTTKMFYRRTTNSPTGMTLTMSRDGTTLGTEIAMDMSGSDSMQYKSIDWPTGSTSTANDPYIRIRTGTGSEDETGKHAYLFGAWIEAADANQEGLRFASIAQGGWTTLNHLDPTVDGTNGKYSDAMLDYFLTSIGVNTASQFIILVQLGQNTATGEVSGSATTSVYTTNIQAVLSRYRSAAARIGAPAPLFILRTIWQGEAGTGARYTSQADIQYALAQANSDIGFVNLNRLVSDTHGAYSTWSSKYLSDAVHQTEAGTVEFERLMWMQIMRDSAAADSPTVVEIRQEIDANSTQLAALTSRIASALTITGGKVDVNDKTGFSLTSAYDAAKTAAAAGAQMDLINAPNAVAVAAIQNGLATSSGLTSLQTHGDSTWATATGFSTFDPTTDRVDLIDNPNAAAISSIQAGLATSGGLSSLQTHGDSTWATATGFSTFNSASDKVQLAASQPSYAPLLASGYTAPDNTSITAIKAKTDLIATNSADSPAAQTAQTNAATAATQAQAANAKLLGNVAAQTGDAFARLGAPTGASVSADIAAVKGDTDTLNGVTFPDNFSLLVISADGEVTASNASGTALTAAQLWSYSQRSLTDGTIRVVNPLQTGTQSWVRGDSYLNADGNARSFAKVDGATWPTDLSGWTITFTCNPSDDLLETDSDAVGFTATGSIVTATGDNQAVRFDFTAAQTGTLTPSVGGYKYDVQASKGNSRVTLETGVLTVVEDQTTG